MRDETTYKRALWRWFLDNASTPGRWGSTCIPKEKREHLDACGISPMSGWPEVGYITEWGNTFNPEIRVPVLEPSSWTCNCGAYGSRNLALYVTGSTSLGDVILGVLAATGDIAMANEAGEE